MKNRIIVFFAVTMLLFKAFAQDFELVPREKILFYPGPSLMLQSISEGIGWITDEDIYVFTNNEALVLNTTTNFKEDIPVEDGRIIFARVAHNSVNGEKELYTLTGDNIAGIRTMPLSETYPQRQYQTESRITATDYSQNGLYIAFGTEGGQVSLAMQLKFTKQIYHTQLFMNPTGVKQISISSDSNNLLSVSKDGTVTLWNIEENKLIGTMKVPPRNNFPVYFTASSDKIISAADKYKIIIRDFDGKIEQEISLLEPMGSFRVSSDGKYLFELAKNNNIYVFKMDDYSLLGYVPYFSNSPIVDFDFSQDYQKLLVTHKDGLVFIMNTADVFLAPDAPQPKLGKGIFSGGTAGGITDGGVVGDFISSDMGIHNLDMRLNLSIPDYPYAVNLTPQIGYIYKSPFYPFYAGGLLEFNFCIPNATFPFAYLDMEKGNVIHSPYLVGPKVSGVVGVFLKPFRQDLGVFVELHPAFSVDTFWFPDYGIKDFYPSPSLELQTGLCWRQVILSVGCLYDYQLGLSVSAGVGWRVKVGSG